MATGTMPTGGATETTETPDPNAPSNIQEVIDYAVLAEKVRRLEAAAPDNVRRHDLEHFATKADLHSAVSELHKSMVKQTWMIVGAIFLAGSLMVAAIKLIPPV